MTTTTNTSPRPNYTARRLLVAVLALLAIYFIALPLVEFLLHLLCQGIVLLHDLLASWGLLK